MKFSIITACVFFTFGQIAIAGKITPDKELAAKIYAKKTELCDLKCGGFDPELDTLKNKTRHEKCLDACLNDNEVVLLKKDLSSCQSQLQLVQEKEPMVYNKLFREAKQIREYAGHSPGFYKADTEVKAAPK
jgi:hypothetical protein